ncbi:hypothetical protein BJ912DRAFT_1044673 [Pholiota molesta]|nr:hypothetical protein BJ912DRAFT_1044673 [Pholiota molesta]
MDNPGTPKSIRAALLSKILGPGRVPTVPKKESTHSRTRQEMARLFDDPVAFAAVRKAISELQRQTHVLLYFTRDLEIKHPLVTYDTPTGRISSSTEADVRAHCLEDCEDKDAYNRKYDQDRASRAESITTKDSGGPNDGTLQPRSEKEDELIRSIVASGMDPLFRLAELDPVLHFITCALYAEVRSTWIRVAELHVSNRASNPLKAMSTTSDSIDELKRETDLEFETIWQGMVAEYDSKL